MSIASLLSTQLVALPLKNANFGIYSAGNAVSLIGMWMQRIAIGWLTWEMTKSGLWLGIIAFADFFPVLLIGPIAGAAADRWDRLRVVKTSQTISLVQATVLFALTASGHINIGLLVALTALQGIVVAFNQPARLALVPSLVPEQESRIGGGDQFDRVQLGSIRRPDVCRLGDRVVRRIGGIRGQCLELCRLLAGAGAHPRRPDGRRPGHATKLLRGLAGRHSLYGNSSGDRRASGPADRAGSWRTAPERAPAGICRRRVPLRCRRPFDPGLRDGRWRHLRRPLAWPPRARGRPDVDRARQFAHGRAGGDCSGGYRAHVGRRPGCCGLWFLHVRGGDCHSDTHSTRRGPTHARTRHGPVRLDFPRRARNRRAGGGARVGAFRAAVAGFLRRAPRAHGLHLDVPQSRSNRGGPAEPGPNVAA